MNSYQIYTKRYSVYILHLSFLYLVNDKLLHFNNLLS